MPISTPHTKILSQTPSNTLADILVGARHTIFVQTHLTGRATIHILATAVGATKCISQIALIGISNFENEDISWTVETAIDKIQEQFGLKK